MLEFRAPDCFTLAPGYMEKHFRPAYEEFMVAAAELATQTFEEFCHPNSAFPLWRVRHCYIDARGFYIDEDGSIMPLDEWLRSAELGVIYYIGGTVDYHA